MIAARRIAGRSWRAARAVWGFAKARVPKWLLPVLAVCLAIPGPLDEVIVLGLLAVPVLTSRQARSELAAAVASAWDS